MPRDPRIGVSHTASRKGPFPGLLPHGQRRRPARVRGLRDAATLHQFVGRRSGWQVAEPTPFRNLVAELDCRDTLWDVGARVARNGLSLPWNAGRRDRRTAGNRGAARKRFEALKLARPPPTARTVWHQRSLPTQTRG